MITEIAGKVIVISGRYFSTSGVMKNKNLVEIPNIYHLSEYEISGNWASSAFREKSHSILVDLLSNS